MDRHTCKLCSRRFPNGRALGGHMRSHMTRSAAARRSLPAFPSSSSSSASEQPTAVAETATAAALVAGGEDAAALVNRRKRSGLEDPEHSSSFAAMENAAAAAAAAGGGSSSLVLQDRESEAESTQAPVAVPRRSKRRRRASGMPPPKPDPSFEPEFVSSASEATRAEEDMALCLMMLSRDAWTAGDGEVEEEGEEEEGERVGSRGRRRSRYQCSTCRKVFCSYQALGGHRARHKKLVAATCMAAPPQEKEDGHGRLGHRIHQCPVCFRVFASGQALGGHRRSHPPHASPSSDPSPLTGSKAVAAAVPAITAAVSSGHAKFAGESMIDLNQPILMEEEVELSAISYAQR